MARRVPGYTDVDLKDIVIEYLKEIITKSSALTPSFTIEQLDEWLRDKAATNGFEVGDVLTQLVRENKLRLQCYYGKSPHPNILFVCQKNWVLSLFF